jgi:hypothetical protein
MNVSTLLQTLRHKNGWLALSLNIHDGQATTAVVCLLTIILFSAFRLCTSLLVYVTRQRLIFLVLVQLLGIVLAYGMRKGAMGMFTDMSASGEEFKWSYFVYGVYIVIIFGACTPLYRNNAWHAVSLLVVQHLLFWLGIYALPL